MINNLLPHLWHILEQNKKCSINVTHKENEIIVKILRGKSFKIFKDKDEDKLIRKLQLA